jgi:hypothetical protein
LEAEFRVNILEVIDPLELGLAADYGVDQIVVLTNLFWPQIFCGARAWIVK